MKRVAPYLLTLCVLAPWGAWAGRFENDVRARWRGAWVVLAAETYSTCAGTYFTNDVSGSFVTARGGRRFEPGELGKVNRVQVKRGRVELKVSLGEPVLLPRPSGPFTLYDERFCRVELEMRVPRQTLKTRDVEGVDRLLEQSVYRFPSRDAAMNASVWNGREREPYPDDYELTLARHAAWQAEQLNLTIDHRIATALEQAEELAQSVDDDAGYLEGFQAGAHDMSGWNDRDCSNLLAGQFKTVRPQYCKRGTALAPETGEQESPVSESWSEGYADGALLVYSLGLVRRLQDCYVEVPSIPAHLRQDAKTLSMRGESDSR